MALGSAIARGITQGLGQGLGFAVDKQQERKREERQAELQWKSFARQQDYLEEKAAIVRQEQREHESSVRAEDRAFQTQSQERGFAHQKDMSRIQFKQQKLMTAQRAAAQLSNFKAQSIFTQNMENIRQQGLNQAQWETDAKKTPAQLAQELADQYARNFSKDQYGAAFQQAMSNLNGKTKVELLNQKGSVKADYTQWMNDPTYSDAIPKATGLGGTEVNPDETFQYVAPEQASAELQTLTEGDKKRKQTASTIGTTFEIQAGAPLDPAVASYVAGFFPDGLELQGSGANLENQASMILNNLITNGEISKTANGWVFTKDLVAYEATQAAQAEQDRVGEGTVLAPQGISEVAEASSPDATQAPEVLADDFSLRTTEAVSPSKEAFFEKEREAKVKANVKSMNKDFNKTATLQTHKTLGELKDKVQTLSPAAQSFLYGAGSLSETLRSLRAKKGNEGAQEALAFLSELESFAGKVRHEQFGSAQTEGEMRSWYKQLSDPSVLQNPETLLAQLAAKEELMGKDVKAISGGYDDVTKREWIKNNPSFSGEAELFDFADRGVEGLDNLDPAQQAQIRTFLDNGGDPAMVAQFMKQLGG